MAYVVVDIETTGLSKSYHRITEIAALRMQNGVVRKEFHTLVNPQVRIPSFITRLTGISNEMVKDAPTIKETIPEFVGFLGDDVFVAHNATFDFGFLSHSAQQHHNVFLANDRLCTRKLATRLLPDLPSKRLSALCEHFRITNEQHHRAMADAQATALVLNNFLDLLKTRGITQQEDVLRFQGQSWKDLVPVRRVV
jgi:DNA polymerase III subunit alpha, Gram-positive type